MTDDMLRALAKNDGVAMVNFWSNFISTEYAAAARAWNERHPKAVADLRAKYKDDPSGFREALSKARSEDPLPKVPLSVLADHIDHMVKVAGIDHVGIGSDFDGVDTLPEGIDGVDSLPKLTAELLRRGYKDEDILKILGENVLRVLERAEGLAKENRSRLFGDGSTKRIDR
jgi:membrane dipeptidase